MKEGDHNISFFLWTLQAKFARDTIKVLVTADGARLESFDDIQREAVGFYHSLLGTTDDEVHCPTVEAISTIMGKSIPEHQSQILATDVMEDEIRQALFAMNENKSTGPDGFTTHFFK